MIACSMFVVGFFLMQKLPLYVKEAWSWQSDIDESDNKESKNLFLPKVNEFYLI